VIRGEDEEKDHIDTGRRYMTKLGNYRPRRGTGASIRGKMIPGKWVSEGLSEGRERGNKKSGDENAKESGGNWGRVKILGE